MKKLLMFGGVALAALVATAALVALPASAVSETYKFTIRGTATEVDRTNKTVTIYTTHTSGVASEELAGAKIEFNVSGAKFYKYDAAGKKVRTTIGNVPVGFEVVAKGAKRGTDRFNVSELTVNPSAFSLVGTVEGFDQGNKIITVNVLSSSYKEKSVKGKDLKVYYGDNTVFRNKDLAEINADELANDHEKVKITGEVVNSWKFEGRLVIDGYTKNK